MPVRLAATFLLLASLTPADHWWISQYGFDRLEQDGSGVVVAVIDTGVDDTHPDLIGTVIGGRDFSGLGSPDGTAPVGPAGYHGTMVASLIVGSGKDSGGVTGVAPGAKLLSLSVGLGVKGADTDQQIADAVVWAVDNGADVINLSLSRNSRTWPESWDQAFLYALSNDVVIVAASGNRSDGTERPSAPATMPGVLAVGGMSKAGTASTSASTEGIAIDITAPAEELLGALPGGGSTRWSGSSAATPLVSGLLALMMQADPEADSNDLLARLVSTATDLGEPGFDGSYGFGAINPALAVASAVTSESNPLGDLEQWVDLYRPTAVDEEATLSAPEPIESEVQPTTEVEPSIQPTNLTPNVGSTTEINPLLYWVLAPLAPLLWLALRKGRKVSKSANSQEGKSKS